MSAPPGPQVMQPGVGEIAAWDRRRSSARQQYAASLAQQELNRNQATTSFNRNMRMAKREQSQARGRFADPYIQRGMLRSGIYQRNLSNFALGNTEALGAMNEGYANALAQSRMSDTMAAQQLASLLSNIEGEEQARRAQLASEIRGVM